MAGTCGITVPTSCVPWVSGPLTSFDWATFTSNPATCNPSVGQVIVQIDKKVKALQDSFDITKIVSGCDSCIPNPVDNTWWNLINSIIINACKDDSSDGKGTPIDITDYVVRVDMRCLTGNCSKPPYTVGQVLDTVFQKLCEWDELIKNCTAAPASANNGVAASRSVYIPNY